MRNNSSGAAFATHGYFNLKNEDWLVKQRVAGKVVAGSLSILQSLVEQGTPLSALELNKMIEDYIQDHDCTATFKGYKSFPAGVCVSVNKELVHGIPKDHHFQEGDVISFDLGATYQGAIADSALTCIYGKPKSERHVALVKATEEALMAGIAAIKVGAQLGVIGNAIQNVAKKHKFASVTQYGGHGLDWNTPHASPFVCNKGEVNEGIRIQPGLAIAIEPMLVIDSSSTRTLDDGWTVVTNDIGAHFEHSIFVHEDRVEIITDRNT